MARRILVIIGHPDPAPHRLCRALARAYVDGALAAGHRVDTIDIAGLDFPLLHSMDEFSNGAVPAPLEDAARALRAAEHIVFIFPLWLGTMPALLKAFLEQVMRPGVAFEYPQSGSGFGKSLLAGRSARIVVTMGMPGALYRLWYLGHGVAGLRRNILNFVGIKPVRETIFGMVDAAGDAKRGRWLERMHKLGEAAR
jgi:putative NADPH-quinone reductase